MNSINKNIIMADKVLDYFPVLSTVTNLTTLWEKAHQRSEEKKDPEVLKDRLFTHIQDKSVVRCVILLIPILGNIIIAVYDILKHIEKASAIKNLYLADDNYKDNLEVVLASYRRNAHAIGYASERLKNDEAFMLEATRIRPSAFDSASERLKNDIEFLLTLLNHFDNILREIVNDPANHTNKDLNLPLTDAPKAKMFQYLYYVETIETSPAAEAQKLNPAFMFAFLPFTRWNLMIDPLVDIE